MMAASKRCTTSVGAPSPARCTTQVGAPPLSVCCTTLVGAPPLVTPFWQPALNIRAQWSPTVRKNMEVPGTKTAENW